MNSLISILELKLKYNTNGCFDSYSAKFHDKNIGQAQTYGSVTGATTQLLVKHTCLNFIKQF